MGLFDWIKRGVDIDGQPAEEEQTNEDETQKSDAQRRKEALLRLTQGGNVTKQPEITGNRTVPVYIIKSNDDIADIVVKLQNNEPVIVDLNKIRKPEIRRTQDFLSGVIFVLNAHISTLVTNIFLITPQGVHIKN